MTLLTEDEAKTKWCPLARASNYGDPPVSVNRIGNCPDNDCHCIASDCMAWRSVPDFETEAVVLEGSLPVWEEKGWKVIERRAHDVRVAHPRKGSGFCGAFGKPS